MLLCNVRYLILWCLLIRYNTLSIFHVLKWKFIEVSKLKILLWDLLNLFLLLIEYVLLDSRHLYNVYSFFLFSIGLLFDRWHFSLFIIFIVNRFFLLNVISFNIISIFKFFYLLINHNDGENKKYKYCCYFRIINY